MVATAPTKSLPVNRHTREAGAAPDLAYFRRLYPETVASFGALPRREEWLRRIWELETAWRADWETRGGTHAQPEALVRSAPPAGRVAEAEFDVVYTGGGAALLHAAALACTHGRRVLVIGGARAVGEAGGVWNLSEDELKELEGAGLFTREEVEAAVLNRYRGGFVKFHDAASRVKAEPLWVSGALDVAVDGERLTALAAARLAALGSKGCAVMTNLRFARAYVEPQRVTIEAEAPGGVRRFFAARLFVDASGADSPVARQLNGGGAAARVRPSVGTVARGFARGEERDEADFRAGEILVSTEDASAHRQLLWEAFAGAPARGDYTTRLFFHDTTDSPADKSLLALFERYFESLPAYKRRGRGLARRAPRLRLRARAARGLAQPAAPGLGARDASGRSGRGLCGRRAGVFARRGRGRARAATRGTSDGRGARFGCVGRRYARVDLRRRVGARGARAGAGGVYAAGGGWCAARGQRDSERADGGDVRSGRARAARGLPRPRERGGAQAPARAHGATLPAHLRARARALRRARHALLGGGRGRGGLER